ncbi:MFS transporter [Novosphingobium sp. 9]|uniref:MFS transporter n=1 Tax=Novosphingobium sp. 9 TaxID=2025349 RepID=UPI0021B5CFD4|nr:MFS transporter [Novosphingobium sp. 9]
MSNAAMVDHLSVTSSSEDRDSGAGRTGLLFGATLGNFLGVTSQVAIPLGVLLVPIAQDLHWSRTSVAVAFTTLSLAQAAMCPIAGWIADRFGTRRTLLTGFAALGLTLLAVSAAPAWAPMFYALFALAGIVGTLASTMVLAKLVSEWFRERRGFWLGLVGGIGNGLGGMIMPGLTGLMAVELGWRLSFAAIGGAMLLVGLPILATTLRSPPVAQSGGEKPEALAGARFAEAMRSPLFWAIFAAVPIGGGALTGVFANTVTVLTTQGIPVAAATGIVTVFALVCVGLEPLAGHMLDGAGRPRRVALFYAGAICGLLLLAHAHTVIPALVGAALTGIGLGTEFSVLPYLLARYFGLREMGAIAGIAYAGAMVSNAISPLLLNGAYDRFGFYAPGLYAVAGLMALALVIVLLLPAFPRAERYSGTSA